VNYILASRTTGPALLSPVEQDLIAILGWFYLQNGLFQKARALFAALQTLCPEYPAVSMRLALADILSGNASRALDALSQAPFRDIDSICFHLLRLQALAQAGRHEEAAEARDRYLALRSGPEVDVPQVT